MQLASICDSYNLMQKWCVIEQDIGKYYDIIEIHSMGSIYFSLSSLPSCSSPRNSKASMIADQVGGGSTLFSQVSNTSSRQRWESPRYLSQCCQGHWSPGEPQSSSTCVPPCDRGLSSGLSNQVLELYIYMKIQNWMRFGRAIVLLL